jgi:hypothetical protein
VSRSNASCCTTHFWPCFPIVTNPAARMPHLGESLGSARVMIGITSERDTDEASPDSAGISRTGRSHGFSKVR